MRRSVKILILVCLLAAPLMPALPDTPGARPAATNAQATAPAPASRKSPPDASEARRALLPDAGAQFARSPGPDLSDAFKLTPGIKTDRRAYKEPPLPALPRAGGKWRDAVFGTELMRATDERDGPAPGFSTYYSHWPTFNADATRLLIRRGADGVPVIKRFDPAGFTLGATELSALPPLPRGTSASGEDSVWHHSDPDILFTHANYANPAYSDAGMKLYSFNVPLKTYTLVKDFDTLAGAERGKDYLGQMYVSADSNVFCFLRRRVGAAGVVGYLVWRRSDDRVLAFVPDNYPQGINEVHVDRSGKWLFVSLNDCPAGCVRQVVRNLDTGAEVPIRHDQTGRPTGHGDVGSGYILGFDGYQGSVHRRRFADPLNAQNILLLKGATGQTDWTEDFHGTLTADEKFFVFGTYDVPGNPGQADYGLFEDEIVRLSLEGPHGFERLAHTRSAIDNQGASSGYWAMPKPTVSRDGRYVAFTSNWENSGRYDLFILKAEPPYPQTRPQPNAVKRARPAAQRPRRAGTRR